MKVLRPWEIAALKKQRKEYEEFEKQLIEYGKMPEELVEVRLRLWVLTGVLEYDLPEDTLNDISLCFKQMKIMPTKSSLELYTRKNFRAMM